MRAIWTDDKNNFYTQDENGKHHRLVTVDEILTILEKYRVCGGSGDDVWDYVGSDAIVEILDKYGLNKT